MSVLSNFTWFIRTSSRNRVRQFAARIKSPRYAIALLFGLAYFFLTFVMPMLIRDGHDVRAQSPFNSILRSVGPLLIAILTASWWLWRTDRDGIALTPAEANLLVPAPLTRRELMQFKLLRAQGGLLISAMITTVVMHSSGVPWPMRFIGSWTLFSTLQLHRYGASLVHTSLREQGRSGWRRTWPAAVVFLAVFGAITWSIVAGAMGGVAGDTIAKRILASIQLPPASYALAPFRAVIAPMNAESLNAWIPAIAIALAIAIAHYFWVIRMDAAFEEGAAAAGAKRAELIEAARQGRGAAKWNAQVSPRAKVRAAWFPLKSIGEPTVAVLWKNILGVTRGMSRRLLILVAAVVAMFLMFASMGNEGSDRSGFEMAGGMALAYGAMITFMGPVRIRHDFRGDLRNMELMRTLPVGGTSLAAMQIIASTIVLTVAQFALLGLGAGAFAAVGKLPIDGLSLGLVVPIMVTLIAINATMIVAHNAFALMFPAWTTQKPAGIEMFGLTMIVVIGSVLVLALALIGPGVVGAAAAKTMGMQMNARTIIPAAIATIAAIYGQLVMLVILLGKAYDKFDITEMTN